MHKADQYREFANTLMIAAQDAGAPTRDLMLGLARTWTALADEADGGVRASANVIAFPGRSVEGRSTCTVKVS